MPDVPTVAESGYPGFDMTAWLALVAPHGLPPEVKARLEKALATLMASHDTQDKMKTAGFEPAYQTIPNWPVMVTAEITRMRGIAERSQIKAD
jgi:tripartite-type tricarboxylate transporter receptor subunit TctC